MKKEKFEKMNQLDRIEFMLRVKNLSELFSPVSFSFLGYAIVFHLLTSILIVVVYLATGAKYLLLLLPDIGRLLFYSFVGLFIIDLIARFVFLSRLKKLENKFDPDVVHDFFNNRKKKK